MKKVIEGVLVKKEDGKTKRDNVYTKVNAPIWFVNDYLDDYTEMFEGGKKVRITIEEVECS